MRGWKEYNVQELIDRGFLQIGDGYRAKNSELSKNGLPFARAGNLTNGFDFSSCDYFPQKDLKKVGEKRSQVGDVAFTSKGTVGRFAFVTEDVPSFVYSPQICFWRSLDADFLDPYFLFYWMNSRGFLSQINAVKGQTDMADYVSLRDQRQMHILIPKIGLQRQISTILSTLDAKISLLHRQNRTLEAMGQVLFKRWFIDFEFPDAQGRPYQSSDGKMVEGEMGEMPEGWGVGTLGDILSLNYGKALKTEDRNHGEIPVIGSSGIVGYHNEFIVNGPGIVIGRKGTIGEVIWIEKDFFPIDTTFFVTDNLGVEKLYFHYFVLKRQHFDRIGSDSAVPGLNRNQALGLDEIIPASSLVNNFNEKIDPIFRKIKWNQSQIQTLTTLRDTLLPKLMSGELRVGEVEADMS